MIRRKTSAPMTDTLTYRVDAMSCDHCRAAITNEVARVAGVEFVDVDLETKLVQVRGENIADDAILAAIDIAGYDAARA